MSQQLYQNFMPYRFQQLPAPLTLLNNEPAQDIVNFLDTLPPGDYEIKISLVADYQAANDKFHFQLSGDFPSPEIVKESKDNAEVLAFTYVFPVVWQGGDMQIDLRGFAIGGDVLVEGANIMVQRVA